MSKAVAVSVEKELLAATKSKGQKSKEAAGDFRARLVRAVSDLTKEEWAALSDEAKAWVNNGVEALEGDKEVEDFPNGPFEAEDEAEEDEAEEEAEEEEVEHPKAKKGKVAKAEVDEDEDEAEEEEEEKPAKAAGKAGKAAPKAGKAAKAAKDEDEDEEEAEEAPAKPAKGATPGRKKGGIHYLRRLILKNPGLDKAKLLEKVTAQGYTMSPTTVGVQLYELRSIKELMKELGMLKEASK